MTVELDPGAANERTALAWQRTALGLLAGSAILARLTSDRLGLWALAAVAVALPACAWVFVESRGRYLHQAHVRRRPRGRGGRAPLAIALAATVLALTELAALLLGG